MASPIFVDANIPFYAAGRPHPLKQASQYAGVSARDLIHVAIMSRIGVDRIVTADQGFDQVRHLQRLDPAGLATWQHLVGT